VERQEIFTDFAFMAQNAPPPLQNSIWVSFMKCAYSQLGRDPPFSLGQYWCTKIAVLAVATLQYW